MLQCQLFNCYPKHSTKKKCNENPSNLFSKWSNLLTNSEYIYIYILSKKQKRFLTIHVFMIIIISLILELLFLQWETKHAFQKLMTRNISYVPGLQSKRENMSKLMQCFRELWTSSRFSELELYPALFQFQ